MDDLEILGEDLRCEDECVYWWVQCMQDEKGALICKTRERACFDDCPG